MSDLSIVIVNWNAQALLLECLDSIERVVRARRDAGRVEAQTLVVDNGSGDGSADAVRARFPWAELIALPHNLGFAAGSNVGLRRARGRHALLLNSDTRVLPGSLERCVRYLDGNPRVGALGPQLVNPDGSKQNCIHSYPGLLTELLPKPLLEWLLPRRFPSKRRRYTAPVEVPAVIGACLFVRGEVLQQVGLLPEDYFFFLEETDWCLQIRRAGWRIVHLPEARVLHHSGASSKKKLPVETRIEYCRSLYHFLRKHRGPLRCALVFAWRALRLLLSVLALLPLLPFLGRARGRWQRDAKMLAWHLLGCPQGWGLPRPQRGESQVRLRAAAVGRGR